MSCFTTKGNESRRKQWTNGKGRGSSLVSDHQSDESHAITDGNIWSDAEIYTDIVRHGSSLGTLQIIDNYIHLGLEMLVAVKPKDNRAVPVPVAIVSRYRGTINRIISLQIQPVPSNTQWMILLPWLIHTDRNRGGRENRHSLEQVWHNRKEWVLIPVPVLDQCEHFCITY